VSGTGNDSGKRPTVAVHKFSSCDGCQLAFLNAGEDLLTLTELVDIRWFAEAGVQIAEGPVDIAFVEGSVSTRREREHILRIREQSKLLITIGACATSGGLQALRNLADGDAWLADLYASPEYIDSLSTATPITDHVPVDFQIWGCPCNGEQVLGAVRDLLFGVAPRASADKVCMECKRRQTVCTMVTRGAPCMGAVTRGGCGALCPGFGRDCYGCFGPAETANSKSLGRRLEGLGLVPDQIARRFWMIHSGAPAFHHEGRRWKGRGND
jgi:coenzyme F420-reducing hydrogenase gamma subunit